jgi:hypothetical protein
MKNVFNYLDFINEATLGTDKIGVNYQLSRPGRTKAFKLSTSTDLETFNIKFEHTYEVPLDTDDVLLIRASSFEKSNYLNLKTRLGLEDGDLIIYKLLSDDINIKWAVAKIGQTTSVLKQFDRTGASARGDYFRETAFLIRLSQIAWEKERVKLKIFSNRGEIEMSYGKYGCEMSKKNSPEFRQMYHDFRTKTNKKVLKLMDDHCNLLINYLGDDIKKVKYLVKNSADNIINKIALNFMRQESIEKTKMAIESGFDFDIPLNANVSKWNPSDIWIVFESRYFTTERTYSSIGIDNIWDLNDFLYESLMERTGVVGVSLKMPINDAGIYKITGDSRLVNRFKDFDISNSKKTTEIDFEFKNKLGDWKEGSGIDCRTFDTNNKSSISLEVKGKKGSGYVSGKAGSIINYLLPDKYLDIKNKIRSTTSKEELRKLLGIDFDEIQKGNISNETYLPGNEKLRKVFIEDLKGDNPKNSNENSRLQSVVFIDWLLSLNKDERDSIITTVIRYAKSESLWSAPHIVLK